MIENNFQYSPRALHDKIYVLIFFSYIIKSKYQSHVMLIFLINYTLKKNFGSCNQIFSRIRIFFHFLVTKTLYRIEEKQFRRSQGPRTDMKEIGVERPPSGAAAIKKLKCVFLETAYFELVLIVNYLIDWLEIRTAYSLHVTLSCILWTNKNIII